MDRIVEFSSANPVLVGLLMVSFFLLVYTELRRKATGLFTVEPAAAVALINNDGVVLDLRAAEAFARGHIVNARNIPLDEFDVNSKKIAKFRKRPIVTVCDTGISSTKITDTLRKSGFERSYGLKGGMAAWGEAGLPVVAGKKTKSQP